jgi:Glycine zipper 2TM domain
MLKTMITTAVLGVMLSAVAASADPPPWAPAHGRRAKDARHEEYRDRDDGPRETRVIQYNEVIYRGDDGRYYCRRSDGTMGLIAGAAIGGLIGNQLAPGKSATLGTLLGAGAGAVIGQE